MRDFTSLTLLAWLYDIVPQPSMIFHVALYFDFAFTCSFVSLRAAVFLLARSVGIGETFLSRAVFVANIEKQ